MQIPRLAVRLGFLSIASIFGISLFRIEILFEFQTETQIFIAKCVWLLVWLWCDIFLVNEKCVISLCSSTRMVYKKPFVQ